ncbi:hypothetical protein RZS08_07875, partial [Arthrospira platensis SPKY1]|nr:hypothetical protein [Arthrospira platensis SPKY1]
QDAGSGRRARRLGVRRPQPGERFRLQVLKNDVLKPPFRGAHAQPLRERNKDAFGAGGVARLMPRVERVERFQVVQAVGQLDDHRQRRALQRQRHGAQLVGDALLFFAGVVPIAIAQVGDFAHEGGYFGAEPARDGVVRGGAGVAAFARVVQQCRRQDGGRRPPAGQNGGRGDGVDQVGVAVFAEEAGVRVGGERQRLLHGRYAGGRQVCLYAPHEFVGGLVGVGWLGHVDKTKKDRSCRQSLVIV